MSSDYANGRADASKGAFDPPKHDMLAGMFESKKRWDETQERRAEYKEGYYDKKREMEDED